MELTLTFIMWFILIMLGVHVGYSLIIVSIFFFAVTGSFNLVPFALEQMFNGVNSQTLLAVPFFVLAGNLMNGGGVTTRIFDFAASMIGHRKGGLAHVNVLASLIFSGMSGSALADAGGLGQLEIKSMKDAGFDEGFAGGITAASCIIGPLVPPSTPLIIYAVLANQSVEKLFMAGFLPGLLTTAALMVMCSILSHKRNYPSEPKRSWSYRARSFKKSFWALLTPVIILVGIFTGYFTPTEAAVVAALYTTILGFFVYKELTFKSYVKICIDSIKTSGTIVLMILGVTLFQFVISREQMPQAIATFFTSHVSSKLALLLMINIVLLLLGTCIDALPLQMILVPILLPAVMAYGINPIHFGVVVIFNLMIGILTPPMGTALFVVARVGNMKFKTLMKGVLPFLIPLIITLILLNVFPQITLTLPRLLTGGV
ncbi:MAG: TRAP transporter large permease [Bullifex sp.]|nr:TRAP transporter large permease [Spirochaetales bacterium]MDY2815611.1 TRAP transporter large permease [Bullifex sp.]MDD7008047.1 TRAP transporter large permease [Spirochaetales bacterium]MDD7536333.1 TRAP transporter large permease [Spirochaetales bacterium]MDY3851160.1 TRAP transporter large permease [Bullifex sp.]